MNDAPDHRGCDYCGLPVSAGPQQDGPCYCCYGCRFAASITGAGGDDGRARWMMTRLGLAVFFSMNVMVFTLLLWSEPAGATAGAAAEAFYGLARHLSLLFTVPALLLLGGPLLDDAWGELRRGRPALNLLLVAGVAAAFVISAWATWRGVGHVYFEVACMVPVAVTLGRWLEASGKLRTTAALRDLERLLPDRVRLVEPEPADAQRGRRPDREVPLAEVRIGDRLRVLPGEHLPTDGTIESGVAALDERTVTGESEPVVRRAGDVVHSGTLDLDGELVVAVTAAPGTGTLERLIGAVTAAAACSGAQRLADAVSAWFLPVVLAAAVLTTLAHGRLSGWPAGVMAGLAVVVVACPCALGLATPMALWAAAGTAARRHVLVRDGDALERLATADVFCFDKTGTLTRGSRVVAVMGAAGATPWLPNPLSRSAATPAAIAAGLAAGSTHVHAAAIVADAAVRGIVPAAIAGARTVPGRGVEGVDVTSGSTARLGSPAWALAGPADWHGVGDESRTAAPGDEPRCVLSIDDRPSLAFWIAEDIRPEAAGAVAALRHRGRTIVLSGDRADRTRAVAATLGTEWQAPLEPTQKLDAIAALRREGRRVVMVGDGINDAPALASADVGVALGCGADVSRWSAAICLLRDDLADLPWLAELAVRTRRTIRWNLLWAFGYNAACIPLAAAGLVHPAVAAVAMVASSLLVVGNSLRLAAAEVGDDEARAAAVRLVDRSSGAAGDGRPPVARDAAAAPLPAAADRRVEVTT